MAGVKGLTPVSIGLAVGSGFGGCLQAENSLQSGVGFAANLVFRSRGHPASLSGTVRPFGVLVPGAMGRAGAKYREWAFGLECQYKTTGNRPLTSRSTGRQKRGAFGSLRCAPAPVTSALRPAYSAC